MKPQAKQSRYFQLHTRLLEERRRPAPPGEPYFGMNGPARPEKLKSKINKSVDLELRQVEPINKFVFV
uniref:SFRICE_036502 n=1 Tax=Spodoptera frugiperda TaxID=7108 RepID=A0A2H1VCV3_SPOFR